MRSRFFKTILKNPANTIFAGGIVAGGGAFLLNQFDEARRNRLEEAKFDQRVNIELTTYDAMVLFADKMVADFEQDNQEDEAQSGFKAFLEAVRLNNVMLAENFINALVKSDALVSNELRDMIIAYAANLGKIEILKVLQKVFGPQEVLRNRRARKLLGYSPTDQALLTDVLEQFFRGPGYPKRNGVEAFLYVKQHDQRDQIVAERQYQPVYTGVVEFDVDEYHKQILSMRSITQDLDQRFIMTRIIANDFKRGIADFDSYLRYLLTEARDGKNGLVGTFIFGGSHWFIGQVRVTLRDQKSIAEIIVIDSLGSISSMTSSAYGMYASVPHAVFDEVIIKLSEDVIQRGNKGCSLVVCDQYGKIMTLDDVMKKNEQYKFAGKQDVLFDYATYHTTGTYKYGVNGCSRPADEDYSYSDVSEFSLFLLPVTMLVQKQSVEHDGIIDDMYEVFDKRDDGRYVVTDFIPCKRFVLGVSGLDTVLTASSLPRQAEFSLPANIGSPVTVKEEIDASVKLVRSGDELKRRNKRLDHSGYAIGNFLSRNSDTLLEKLHAMEESSVSQREERHLPSNKF